jgi:hypothetical protein
MSMFWAIVSCEQPVRDSAHEKVNNRQAYLEFLIEYHNGFVKFLL